MNSNGAVVVLVASALWGCQSSAPVKKVLLIGLDGVRVDILESAATPNIDALIANGVFGDDGRTGSPTVSGPGWSSMLIGVWPDKHDVHSNDFTGNAYADYPDFLTRLEELDPSYNTYAIVDWPPLGSDASGGPLVSDRIDMRRMIDGDELGYRAADSLSVAAAVAYLTDDDPDALFIYLGNIDVVGHDHGSLAPQYQAAIETADAQVGQLMRAVQQRSSYDDEDWLVLMSTDHGRTDDGGHGGESDLEHRIFFLASGPSVVSGAVLESPSIVDIAVTALAHFGVTVDPAWRLDGRAVGMGNE